VLISQLLQSESFQILITVILTSYLTFWLTRERDKTQLNIDNMKKVLDEVYVPIISIINAGIWPMEGYEGLSETQVNQIIKILEVNELLIDAKLSNFACAFEEDVYINGRNGGNPNYVSYDDDRNFLDYVLRRYHRLRKDVYLPYDKSYVGFRKYLTPVIHWFGKQRLSRRIRRLKTKK